MRRALSLAINRDEINKAVFYGLGTRKRRHRAAGKPALPSRNSPRPGSPIDPDQANALLDEVGLTKRDDDGIRLLPDGRPAQIIVETAGESTLETDVLELVTDHWRKVGIALFIRTSQRDVFRSRAIGGEIMMSMWSGIDNGVPTAEHEPGPAGADGRATSCNGRCGAPITCPTARWARRPTCPRRLDWSSCSRRGGRRPSEVERTKAWTEMLALYTDQVFSIGIVNGTLQPVCATARLRNMPDAALYGFEPDVLFRRLHADTFWLDDEAWACCVTSSGASP